MKKWIAAATVVSVLAFGGTAMAKPDAKPNKQNKKGEQTEQGCAKVPPGLQIALKNVKNPKAKASIQKNIDKHKTDCKDDNEQVLTDAERVAKDKAELQIGFAGTDTMDSVTAAVQLPVKGVNGSTITWTSSKPNVLSATGTVNLPEQVEEVVLTAVISYKTASDVKTFKVKVQQKLTDAQRVAADKAALEIDFGGPDTAASITRPLDKLPALGVNGSTVVWTSSVPSVLSNDGKTLNRPAVDAADVAVVLSASITSGAATEVKLFTLTVKKQYTAVEKLAADKSELEIGFDEKDSATSVTKPLVLSASGYFGSNIVWYSSLPQVISNDGKIVNRPVAGAGDVSVTFTAYMSNNGYGDVKTFTVIVKQQ